MSDKLHMENAVKLTSHQLLLKTKNSFVIYKLPTTITADDHNKAEGLPLTFLVLL